MVRRTTIVFAVCIGIFGAMFLIRSSSEDLATAQDPAGGDPAADANEPPPDCGPQIAKGPNEPWTCTFSDDFDSGELDRRTWTPMTTANSGFTHNWECYVDDPSTVSVAGGNLELTARRLDAPTACGQLFQTQYLTGMVHTKYSFAQAYGRFEARIKFQQGQGHASSWWLWPRDMAYRKQSGEIDVAEHYGHYPDIVSPFVHIKTPTGDKGRGAYCTLAGNETGFHTYAVEWRPLGGMVFLFDDKPCMTFDNWNPGDPLTYPQPFDQPFYLNLTHSIGWGSNQPVDSSPFPTTMYIDYVRVWN